MTMWTMPWMQRFKLLPLPLTNSRNHTALCQLFLHSKLCSKPPISRVPVYRKETKEKSRYPVSVSYFEGRCSLPRMQRRPSV